VAEVGKLVVRQIARVRGFHENQATQEIASCIDNYETISKRKFIYKQSPAKSIIRIESQGRTYLALDGQIDNPVMGNGYIGIVAFQPFENPVNELSVTIYIDGQACGIVFSGVQNEIQEELSGPTLSDHFIQFMQPRVEKLKYQVHTAREQIEEKKRQSAGCMIWVILCFVGAILRLLK
jgi:hypothetical protein